MMRNPYRQGAYPPRMRYYSEEEVQPVLNEVRRLKMMLAQQEQAYTRQIAAAEAEAQRWQVRAVSSKAEDREQTAQIEALRDEIAALKASHAELEAKAAAKPIDQSEFLLQVLPFVDNLERALKADESDSPLRQGIEITLAAFQNSLAQMGVEPVVAEGEDFDPHVHEAVALVHDPARKPGSVAAVEEKGYSYGERLLRPARVTVVGG